MPTVYRRRQAEGTFAPVYTTDIWIEGRKFSRSTGHRVEREAKRRAIEIEAQIRQDLKRRHDPLTLNDAMGRYWEEHAKALPSAGSVKYHVKRLLDLMGDDIMLAEMGNAHVHDYVVVRSKMPDQQGDHQSGARRAPVGALHGP
jgi:hypothetical protein